MKNLILQVHVPMQIKRSQTTFSYNPELYNESVKSITKYAKRIEVDYKLITESQFPHPAFDRFQLFNSEFQEYDQIMYVDCDMMLHEGTPNLLEWTQTQPQTFFATPDKGCVDYFNSGFFIIKRPLINSLQPLINETVSKHLRSEWKDQDAFNSILPHDEWCKLSRDWNGVMAVKRPLFSAHYAGTRKRDYSIEKHEKTMKEKVQLMSEMSHEEILNKYIF